MERLVRNILFLSFVRELFSISPKLISWDYILPRIWPKKFTLAVQIPFHSVFRKSSRRRRRAPRCTRIFSRFPRANELWASCMKYIAGTSLKRTVVRFPSYFCENLWVSQPILPSRPWRYDVFLSRSVVLPSSTELSEYERETRVSDITRSIENGC